MKWLSATLLFATPAGAEELKSICPDRGAFQTCILDTGHFQIESSLVDWASNKTLLIGDSVIRYGVSDTDELQIAWSPMVQKDGIFGSNDFTFLGDIVYQPVRFL